MINPSLIDDRYRGIRLDGSEEVNPMRAHVANHENGVGRKLALDIEIVLDHVRCLVIGPIPGKGLSREKSGSRGGAGRNRINGVLYRRCRPRGSGSEPGLIGLHSNRVMEEPEAGANRSFMIGERVVGDSDSRIEIGPGRIFLEYIRDLAVVFVVEEIFNHIEPAETLGWVGIKLPPH